MSLVVKHLFEFGEFRLDTKEKILVCGETPIELTPKTFELLTLFVENHGRLLTKEEIMEKIWADNFVEESNLTFNIGQLRKILGDDAQAPIFIKTVRHHGYRFIAPVKPFEEPFAPPPAEEKPPVDRGMEEFSTGSVGDLLPKPLSKPEEKPAPRSFPRLHPALIVLVILLISSLAVAFILSKNFKDAESNAPILNAPFKSEKLTNNGSIYQAVISPDGKWMAYSSESAGKQGVWIRRFDSSENVQIVANSDDFYFGLAFSHDGDNLYFARGKGAQAQTIYRVSTRGGIPKEVIGKTEGWFSLSPDDRRISFVRCPYREDDYCSLYVADTADGQNERKLLTRPRPIRIGENQFSPDGQSIAVALGQSRNGSQEFSLIDVDINSGAEREITNHRFFDIKYLAWLPDKSGVLLTAYDRFYRPLKIYRVSNQTGEIQTLTKDSNSYNHISLDRSFRKMVATQVVSDFRMWIAPADNPEAAKPICAAIGRGSFAPSGKIVYASITDGAYNIWTIDPDGANQRQLTSNQGANIDPRVSPDEQFIYFSSNRSGSKQLWRMNMDGSGQTQVSDGEGGRPVFISPDGQTIYYETAINSNLGKITVSRDEKFVSEIISKERMLGLEFNATGDMGSYFSRKPDEDYEIVLMSVVDGKIIKTFNVGKLEELKTFWARDGKSLFYLAGKDLKTTVWQFSLETGKSEKFAELGNQEEVSDFAFSADGKIFFYVRGKWRHDSVLIEGLK